MKVIFIGTPNFAVPTLNKIIESDHEVACVFTQAPKPQGRGMKLTKSPIHEIAEKNNIPVHNPKSLKNSEIWALVDSIECDIIVVVAYGFIIPKQILESKKYGCINLHPSRLPRFRGAAPLQRTIIEGDTETSVCVIQMDEGLDTGDILLQEDFKIPGDITLPELHDTCADIGAKLIVNVLDNIEILPKTKQSEDGVYYAHKLTKEEGMIDWNESAITIDRKIRGMNPWPGTFFNYNDMYVKLLKAHPILHSGSHVPGTILHEESAIVCGDGILRVDTVQKPGKGPIDFTEFLRWADETK